MKKILKFIKNNYAMILSFVIPIVIMLIVAAFNDLYPFGKFSFAKYDGYYQYPGFTAYFKRVLLGKASLFYSFKGLLGYNYYATAIYYMFNPTNILCIFFNNENLLTYYSLIVYLRIALCGLTMCLFLKYKFKEKKDFFLVIFSVAYALMGYNMCYFFNFMYFDVVVLFPIVMIGLEKLIHENKITLYIVSLTLSIMSNFYIGYMVCLFSLLYFIYSYILLEKKDKKIIKNFAISSVLCGIMCAIIILPVAYELFQGKVDLYTDPTQIQYFKFNLNFLNIFYKFSPGSTAVYDIKYGTVNIYCSLLVAILVIKYFFNTKISVKEKIVTGSFIAFFILSISFNLIDYFWHLMQRPIWYPNRYIFTFSFFLIMIAYKSFRLRDGVNMNIITKVIIFTVFILLMVYPAYKAIFTEKVFQGVCFILSSMLIIQYTLFTENRNAIPLLIMLFFIEVTINGIFTIKQLSNAADDEEYKFNNTTYTKATKLIKENEKNDSFYRVEFTKTANYNNGAMYDYNGLSIFNSLRNGKIMNFFDNYFAFSVRDSASITMNNMNPYITSLLGFKYISGTSNEYYYELLGVEGTPVYTNNEALSLGFMVNKSIYDYSFQKDKKIENTKEIVDTLTNKDNEVYVKLNNYEYYNCEKAYDESSDRYTINKTVEDNDYYVLLKGKAEYDGFVIPASKSIVYVSVTATINGKINVYDFNNNKMPIFLKKGDTYEFKFVSSVSYDASYIDFYLFRYDTYSAFINDMKENSMELYDYKSDSSFKAKVTSNDNDTVLFTSIPYDKGWTIHVDGSKVKYNICYDAFICIDLEEGEHTIEFNYIPKLFIIGLIISLMSLTVTIVFIRKTKKSII